MLAQAPHLEIEGECRDACEALACIRQKRPDLVLVDARLNESSGIDLIRQVPEEHRPLVIFTAAVNRYAVEAFEVHALDYLLRPFSQARLNAALERARQRLEIQAADSAPQQPCVDPGPVDTPKSEGCISAGTPLSRARMHPDQAPQAKGGSASLRFTETSGETVYIKFSELRCIESARNYAVLQTRAQNHVIRQTLARLEASLPQRQFLRISRSTIVNCERVKGIQHGPQGEQFVLLDNSRPLRMTRNVRQLRQVCTVAADQR